jgi:hypothetical protein
MVRDTLQEEGAKRGDNAEGWRRRGTGRRRHAAAGGLPLLTALVLLASLPLATLLLLTGVLLPRLVLARLLLRALLLLALLRHILIELNRIELNRLATLGVLVFLNLVTHDLRPSLRCITQQGVYHRRGCSNYSRARLVATIRAFRARPARPARLIAEPRKRSRNSSSSMSTRLSIGPGDAPARSAGSRAGGA